MERRALRLRRETLAELDVELLHRVVGAQQTRTYLCCDVTVPTARDEYTLCRPCPTEVAR